ncbi:DUF5715 family protein [Algoriphagus litoralis]|uniref:DUF5715 family protein n=1 Tax=Algoriphagus litoralis TaxID=2202829 RepID=UPI000DB90793|nr:DUF5715 family protein [Algoriphagus litoralis]
MNKTTPIFIFSFFIFFSLGTLAMVSYQPELTERFKESYADFLSEPVPTEPAVLPEPIAPVKFDISQLLPFKGRIKKDTYEDHLIAAEETGVGTIKDEDQLFNLVCGNFLVEAKVGIGYKVEQLTHSFPYMTPNSKKVLEELGAAFQALSGEGNYFTITSATRTEEQQKNLKRRNRNAADGNSSHSFGVSFDISYIRFNGIREWNQKAQKNLETVLNHFQQTGKIYVIKERKQSCYHVTVR